jgi:hypothetical protein
MARKRAERQGTVQAEKSAQVQIPIPNRQKVVLYALCPCCGRAIPERRGTVRGKAGNIETQPYFNTIEWDPNKPFGIARLATGKGSFRESTYIGKDEAPELFEAVKGRLIAALKEWMVKGWISRDELKDLVLAL